MEATPRVVLGCQTEHGAEPFSEWLDTLDGKAQAIVLERVDRVERGNFGDCNTVGGGVSELRIDFGTGYRVVELYGGRVDRVGKDGPRINPFALAPTESNIKFLYSSVKLLLPNGGAELEPEDDDVIHKAVHGYVPVGWSESSAL